MFLWQRRVIAAKGGKFESKTKKLADSRFVVSGDDELQKLKEKSSNSNTKKHTNLV